MSKALRLTFEDAWLLGGARTPFVDYRGALAEISPIDLGIKAARAAIARTGVKAADIPGLLDGRIFSGREALQAKLVDQIGGEDEAVKWLKDEKNVPQNAKLVDWKPTAPNSYGFAGMSARIAGFLLGSNAGELVNFLSQERSFSTLGLDGLLSVWHPSEK